MSSVDQLASFSNLSVQQTKKGCFQELLGCEANTEFKIATIDQKKNYVFYAVENTECLVRFFCANNRPWNISMSAGETPGGAGVASYHRPFALPVANMKCCCFQSVEAKDVGGNTVGIAKEECWYCVPSFGLYDATGTTKTHTLHMPTCWGGVCVNFCAEGCCNCRIPFYVYAADKDEPDAQVGSITKIWGGVGKELLTDADTFEVTFPANSDSKLKATLVGACFLLNQVFFESDNKSQVGN